MDDVLNNDRDEWANGGFHPESDIEDMLNREMKRGTGLVFPTKFVPSNGSVKPTELFTGRRPFLRINR
jgi:hypothetical protein